MPDTKAISVVVRSDEQGHWVEWTINGDSSSLGPYQDDEMAENVRAAKERELNENPGRSL
ncbi:MAG TPA: hypothetical protein VGN98_02600 [Tianweitania sediminis]|jgi:hypothetical protein|nr:hypothetical protein [Tianweitania sediminis]